MCFVDKNIRQLGWEDRVRYVLTVHDEVVFEIRPQYLMEIVRKLDEWMTYPWKLPKAHGRDWVVPLLTEPGIDINWKARYDYFAMVDGIVPQPKEINDAGEFVGKLKSDQYFTNGRVYQRVPDFLQGHIWPLDSTALPPVKEEKTAALPSPVVEKAPLQMEETKTLPLETVQEKETTAVPASEKPVSVKSNVDIEIDIDAIAPLEHDFTIDDAPSSAPIPTSSPSVIASPVAVVEVPKAVVTPKVQTPPLAALVPTKAANGLTVGEAVHRWTFQGALTEKNEKKLSAVIMLCEGDVPLRIVSPKGDVIDRKSVV